MKLPGRLRETTLGDLLGTLYRNEATGRLQLIETQGARNGRTHFIELESGRVTKIESDNPAPKLGEILELDVQARRRHRPSGYRRIGEHLVLAGLVSQQQLQQALRQQLLHRLEGLYEIKDAIVLFRTPRPRRDDPTQPPPLETSEFLEGRPRARVRRGPVRKGTLCGKEACRLDALAVLGLPESATQADVQAAFRRLAQEAHPDRYPTASPDQKRALLSRFASLSRAYHALTA